MGEAYIGEEDQYFLQRRFWGELAVDSSFFDARCVSSLCFLFFLGRNWVEKTGRKVLVHQVRTCMWKGFSRVGGGCGGGLLSFSEKDTGR